MVETSPSTPCAVDFSFARPLPGAIKEAGYVGVIRYLSTAGNPKNVDAAEAHNYLMAGLGVRLVWETTADRANDGEAAGAADARAARAMADSIGCPRDVPIFFAVDEQVAWDVVAPYLAGVASVEGAANTEVYGDDTIVEAAAAAGYGGGSGHWQTEAWSGTTVSGHAALYQRVEPTLPRIAGTNPGDYDENAVVAPLRWWSLAPVPPTPGPGPTPTPPAPTPPAPTEADVNLPVIRQQTPPYTYNRPTQVVQALLGVPADGLFGPGTAAAVEGFQRSRGLGVDGIVGQQTWTALLL